MEQAVIRTYGLSKVYGATAAVNKVNITVNKGDIYGFIGSNGAGKTTLIRLIMGLITPTEGTIELLGCGDKASLLRGRQKIGCIVETPSLMLNMNARECLTTQALLYGLESIKAKIEEVLALVGLGGTGGKKVKDFSLGMKQRLAIAQALLGDPEILILDEPTNGMDPQGIVEMRMFLLHLQKEKGLTMMISSHILAELEQLASRFGIISSGVLIDEFSRKDLEAENTTLEKHYLAKLGLGGMVI